MLVEFNGKTRKSGGSFEYKNGLHTLVYKPFLEYFHTVDTASIVEAGEESMSLKKTCGERFCAIVGK